MVSRSFSILAVPFHGGMQGGNTIAEGVQETFSASSSYASIWEIRSCRSSSSSFVSTVTALPFSATDNLLTLGCRGDTRTSPIGYLFFYGHGVHGDFGTSSTPGTSPSSSWVTQDSRVTSINRTLVLDIVWILDSLGLVLTGDKVARCSLLYISSNLKKPSVAPQLPPNFYGNF